MLCFELIMAGVLLRCRWLPCCSVSQSAMSHRCRYRAAHDCVHVPAQLPLTGPHTPAHSHCGGSGAHGLQVVEVTSTIM